MNKYLIILLAILAIVAGFYAFYLGIIILKIFIGLAVLSIFASGFGIGYYIGKQK